MSLSTTDLILLTLIAAITLYWLYARLWPSTPSQINSASSTQDSSLPNGSRSDLAASYSAAGRDFVKKMELQKKKVVVFYGSQTGTAEDYATRIAKEAKSKFGISSLVADPDDYDFDALERLTSDQLAIFVLATYGEGEPTDNAVTMLEYLKEQDPETNRLDGLNYVMFALGNRTYEQFCQMGKIVDELLSQRGATRLGELGMGDDDKSMEEDYLAWKDPMWEQVQKAMGWEEGAGSEEPDFLVKELEISDPTEESKVYRGELSGRALIGTRGVFDAKNPCPAKIVNSKELFAAGERNCVHMEFEIKDTGIRYQAGDHLAVWPVNPDSEVTRLMKMLGLWEKRETAVEISSLDPMLAKVPFPSPASYEAIFRHYLDISCTASRQLLSALAKFAPTEAAGAELKALGTDKERYLSRVAGLGLRLGECLMAVLEGGEQQLLVADPRAEDFGTGWLSPWQIPFDQIVSGLPRLQPRFYSISSSPKMFPDQIHITAVVLKYPSGGRLIYGCGTNYLLNAKMYLHGEKERMAHQPIDQRPAGGAPYYTLFGPRNKYLDENQTLRIPIHVRRSNFRLPTSPKIPVVMIGPGTGVAPFRSFVQERVMLGRKTKAKAESAGAGAGGSALAEWAEMVLFYGCRKAEEDFLYKDEWAGYTEELDGKFEMLTAVSRREELGGKKEYVQDLMRGRAEQLKRMVVDRKGYVFVCGDGKNMVKGVEEALKEIFERSGLDGASEIKFLKDRNRLLLDVWS